MASEILCGILIQIITKSSQEAILRGQIINPLIQMLKQEISDGIPLEIIQITISLKIQIWILVGEIMLILNKIQGDIIINLAQMSMDQQRLEDFKYQETTVLIVQITLIILRQITIILIIQTQLDFSLEIRLIQIALIITKLVYPLIRHNPWLMEILYYQQITRLVQSPIIQIKFPHQHFLAP